MLDGWLNLAKFLTTSFGLPGSCAVAISAYLIYLLREERLSHNATRDKIDALNEKRLEQTILITKTFDDLKEALRAVSAILEKKG